MECDRGRAEGGWGKAGYSHGGWALARAQLEEAIFGTLMKRQVGGATVKRTVSLDGEVG